MLTSSLARKHLQQLKSETDSCFIKMADQRVNNDKGITEGYGYSDAAALC